MPAIPRVALCNCAICSPFNIDNNSQFICVRLRFVPETNPEIKSNNRLQACDIEGLTNLRTHIIEHLGCLNTFNGNGSLVEGALKHCESFVTDLYQLLNNRERAPRYLDIDGFIQARDTVARASGRLNSAWHLLSVHRAIPSALRPRFNVVVAERACLAHAGPPPTQDSDRTQGVDEHPILPLSSLRKLLSLPPTMLILPPKLLTSTPSLLKYRRRLSETPKPQSKGKRLELRLKICRTMLIEAKTLLAREPRMSVLIGAHIARRPFI